MNRYALALMGQLAKAQTVLQDLETEAISLSRVPGVVVGLARTADHRQTFVTLARSPLAVSRWVDALLGTYELAWAQSWRGGQPLRYWAPGRGLR